ncbi:MAG TPA: SpoIIE family protein phosphatase [Capillimicrobium sp.]|nr:SpoIIE family protein phosphatase [Capillimicrobium sp.]
MSTVPRTATSDPDVRDPAVLLLVEDDEGDAFLVRELLTEAAPEISILTVATLAEAEAQAARADCALLDLGLPDSSGLEGLVRLRRVAPETPVVVLTGLDHAHLGIEAVRSGAHGYLAKGGVDGERLARAIRYAIARGRAERSERALLEAQLHAQENARLERGLLPTALVRDPGTRLIAGYRPGRRRAVLGGDFYDAVELDDGTLHVAIGDVCGHGADEAALGVCLRIAWRSLTLAQRPAPEVLRTMDRLLVHERHRPDLFTTFALLAVAPDRRSVDVWLAGHPPPVLVGEDGTRELAIDRVHLPLGLVDDQRWEPRTVALPERWTLLLYTDGLIEGRAGDGPVRLGVDGLTDAVDALGGAARATAAGEELLDALIEHVEQLNGGPHADDVAAVLVSSRAR